MPIIADQDFNSKVEFMGERINTCMYRFHQMLTTRRSEFARITQSTNEEQQNLIR